ncbi:MAG: histidine phosphatase family protein [Oscillospiraceae bacterium]|nr:histidine phosphatase family protein [Oscillospiraceae bacterium]MBQ7089255.1 histidine phosphatase family protein [Clostridia bacterium]
MKLIIIRHGDPNYELDTLTPGGWEEAELLAERISRLDVKNFYVSPLGRARDTASVTLKKMGRTAETMDWLREFPINVIKPGETEEDVLWDWKPADWTAVPEFYDPDKWQDVPIFAAANVREGIQKVKDGLDELLAKHGYVRHGLYYNAERANEDTIVFFCHFGLECVLLGHLLNVSPMILWHGFCAAPTSVTTIYTEERREGQASFRVAAFGDVSHLYVADREPAFSARFCETFANKEQLH